MVVYDMVEIGLARRFIAYKHAQCGFPNLTAEEECPRQVKEYVKRNISTAINCLPFPQYKLNFKIYNKFYLQAALLKQWPGPGHATRRSKPPDWKAKEAHFRLKIDEDAMAGNCKSQWIGNTFSLISVTFVFKH